MGLRARYRRRRVPLRVRAQHNPPFHPVVLGEDGTDEQLPMMINGLRHERDHMAVIVT